MVAGGGSGLLDGVVVLGFFRPAILRPKSHKQASPRHCLPELEPTVDFAPLNVHHKSSGELIDRYNQDIGTAHNLDKHWVVD